MKVEGPGMTLRVRRIVLPGLLFSVALLVYLATAWIASVSRVPLDGEGGSAVGSGVVPIAFLMYAAVGAVVAARRPEHHVGWLLCVVGFVAQVQGLASAAVEYAAAPSGSAFPDWLLDAWLMAPLRNLWVVSFGGLGLLLFIFPNGRIFSRSIAPGTVLAAFTMIVGLVSSGSATPPTEMRFPLFDALFSADIADGLYDQGRSMSGLSLLALFVLGAISMVVRLRRARGVEHINNIATFEVGCNACPKPCFDVAAIQGFVVGPRLLVDLGVTLQPALKEGIECAALAETASLGERIAPIAFGVGLQGGGPILCLR